MSLTSVGYFFYSTFAKIRRGSFYAQKRLKFAKLLKNIEVSSKILQNKPSKYIHLRTSLSACKITKKSPFLAIFELWLGWLDYSALCLSCTGTHRLCRPAYFRLPFVGSRTNFFVGSNPALNTTKKSSRQQSELFFYGWGGWIRTNECRHQKPMPYHLATPQQ